MSSPKELFLKDTKLASAWAGIAHSDTFERTLGAVRGEFMRGRPSREQIIGAEAIIHIFETITDAEPTSFEFPSTGLYHDLEPKPLAKKE